VADEVMMTIAELLPGGYRGYYRGGLSGEYRYLEFAAGPGKGA
jgi:hypothetical protein